MRNKSPHWTCGSFQFSRESCIVSVGLKFYVRFHFTDIDIHALEHGQKVKPHVQQLLVLHEPICYGGMGEHIVEVRHQRPVAESTLMYSDNIFCWTSDLPVVSHHVFCTVHHLVVVLLGITQAVLSQDIAHHVLQ